MTFNTSVNAFQSEVPKLNQETISPSESEEIDKFSEIVLKMQNIDTQKDKNKIPRRGFHGKSHGCLKGEIIPLPNRNKETRFGIFDDSAVSRPLIMRFSNGMGRVNPDRLGLTEQMEVTWFLGSTSKNGRSTI